MIHVGEPGTDGAPAWLARAGRPVRPSPTVLALPAAYDILPGGHRGRTAAAERGKRVACYHAAGPAAAQRLLDYGTSTQSTEIFSFSRGADLMVSAAALRGSTQAKVCNRAQMRL